LMPRRRLFRDAIFKPFATRRYMQIGGARIFPYDTAKKVQ
jgi:hypothetical protein